MSVCLALRPGCADGDCHFTSCTVLPIQWDVARLSNPNEWPGCCLRASFIILSRSLQTLACLYPVLCGCSFYVSLFSLTTESHLLNKSTRKELEPHGYLIVRIRRQPGRQTPKLHAHGHLKTTNVRRAVSYSLHDFVGKAQS